MAKRRCRHCRQYTIPAEAPKHQWWCSFECRVGHASKPKGEKVTLRKPKVRPKKQKSLARIVDDLAVLLQKLVRLKAADKDGNCRCVTCGKVDHWKYMQGGHFIERSKKATKVIEENIHPQCQGCNMYRMKTATGVLEYRRYMVDTYGEPFVQELEQMAKQPVKFDRAEIMAEQERVKAQIRELEAIVP